MRATLTVSMAFERDWKDFSVPTLSAAVALIRSEVAAHFPFRPTTFLREAAAGASVGSSTRDPAAMATARSISTDGIGCGKCRKFDHGSRRAFAMPSNVAKKDVDVVPGGGPTWLSLDKWTKHAYAQAEPYVWDARQRFGSPLCLLASRPWKVWTWCIQS